jgi:serine/threonine protein phosphatase PrpC
MKITVGKITDKGLNPKRELNEDSLLTMPERGLFLVADGVGGRRGGQVASQTVVEVFTRVFSQDQSGDLRELVINTIDLCNQKIFEETEISPELKGMATTIALVCLEDKPGKGHGGGQSNNRWRAIIAHVGDSRVYRFDQDGLVCLTEDHSDVNDALRAGMITEEQAARHPNRNVINRAVGAELEVQPDIMEIGGEIGEREADELTSFLICSDGITRHITNEEIARLMRSGQRPEAICQSMKELCYMGGAEDNLTAIVIDLGERDYVEEPTRPSLRTVSATASPVSQSQTERKSRRIEVDLSQPKPDEDRSAGGAPSQGRSRFRLFNGGSKDSRSQNIISKELVADHDEPLPKKGELSTAMKVRLIVYGLVVGAVIGALFGKPLVGMIGNYFGIRDPIERRLVAQPPRDAEVGAAYARFMEGYPNEGRQRLKEIINNNPQQAEAIFYLGRMDYAEGKYDEANDHFTQALKIDPNRSDFRIYLAMTYLQLNQTRNARDVLQPIISPPETATSPTPTVTSSATPGG